MKIAITEHDNIIDLYSNKNMTIVEIANEYNVNGTTISRILKLRGVEMRKAVKRPRNLLGQKFNMLTPIKYVGIVNGNSRWLCRCDCGQEKVVSQKQLTRKDQRATQSCGCKSHLGLSGKDNPMYGIRGKDNPNFKDITGQRFGKLVVIKYVKSNKHKNTMWDCICDCGNTTIVSSSHLISGAIRTCGCSHHRKGKDNPGYNHSLTDEERIIGRHIPGYKEWVQAVFKRDNYTCQVCGDDKGGNLNAHHLESYNSNPTLRTTLENGITLCKECHKNFHHQYSRFNNTTKQFEEFKEKYNE